jgi:hypothetical protein
VAPRDRPSGGGLKPPRDAVAVVVSNRGQGAVEVSGGDQEGVALKAPVLGLPGGRSPLRRRYWVKVASEPGSA